MEEVIDERRLKLIQASYLEDKLKNYTIAVGEYNIKIYKTSKKLFKTNVAIIDINWGETITVKEKSIYPILKEFGEKFNYRKIEKDYPEAGTENRIRTGKAVIRTDDPGPYTGTAIPEKTNPKIPIKKQKETIQQQYNNSIGMTRTIDFYKCYRIDFKLQDIPEDKQYENLQTEQPEIYEKWLKWFKEESRYRQDLKIIHPEGYHHLFNRWLFDYCFLGIPEVVTQVRKSMVSKTKRTNIPLKKEIENCINNLDIIIDSTNNEQKQRTIKLRNELVTTLNELPKEIRKGWSSRMYKANELLTGEQ